MLQELWDRSWRVSGAVMVILCGSYVGFMEREVLDANAPLDPTVGFLGDRIDLGGISYLATFNIKF